MKYVVTFNVIDAKTGRHTPLKVSCEFKDLDRWSAVRAMTQYCAQHNVLIGVTPTSIENVGPRVRRAPKVRTPSL